MDYKAIEQIIKTASENELSYLEIETEGIHITMQKGGVPNILKQPNEGLSETAVERAVIAEKSPETEKVNENKPQQINGDENIKIVTSPIVGTFYRSGGPEADAFVEVGTVVKKGQTLCIIEAMKLMNEIEAEFDGEIVQIMAEDEQMIEYGQALFKVKAL